MTPQAVVALLVSNGMFLLQGKIGRRLRKSKAIQEFTGKISVEIFAAA